MRHPSAGEPSLISFYVCCLKINWKFKVSTGIFIFLAYICKTEVRNPWGKKNADIQYIFGLSNKAFLKKVDLSIKSTNHEDKGFMDG